MERTRLASKKELTKTRIHELEVLADAGKLGEKTITVMPEDIELMFMGKMAIQEIESKVRYSNIKHALTKAYGGIYPNVDERLTAVQKEFEQAFDVIKKKLNKQAKKHPLCERLCKIKGVTPYRIALIMAHIKDISKFDTPSKLCVYAGVASLHGRRVCKRNLKYHQQIKQEAYKGDPEKYTEFGFNTKLSQQLFVVSEATLKARGFFYEFYQGVKKRLIERAINKGQAVIATPEEIKESKGVKKAGRYYMVGRKNQSVEMWSHSNAMVRIQRTILHFIYTEWRTLRGMEARNPYPIDYLGHSNYIKLEEVIEKGG